MNRRLALPRFALVAVTLAASLTLRGRARRAQAPDAATRGWWNLAVADADRASDEELVRVLSLPLLSALETAQAP